MTQLENPPESGNIPLPNGCTLYWHTDGNCGRVYISDEIGGGVHVWTPSIVSDSTLLAAIVQEASFCTLEAEIARRATYSGYERFVE
jgi:hypothetical protein